MKSETPTVFAKESVIIPRIIHQVYEDMNGPSNDLRVISSSWKKFHPEWEYRFWNKDSIEDLLHSVFPEFLPVYRSYPYNVQRWDAIRYLILYHFGGLYADMDYECLEPLNLLLQDADCCMGLEPRIHAMQYNKPFMVGNALMATTPAHSYFKQMIEYMIENQHTVFSDIEAWQIFESTGPFMTTRNYNNYHDKEQIKLLPDELIAPLCFQEVRMLVEGNHVDDIYRKIEKAYAIHYFVGSWLSQVSS